MEYIEGFKYQLHKDETYQSKITGRVVNDTYYSLAKNGVITAKAGFAWDGCSGSIDTDTNMRAGLFHDIGCIMIARKQAPIWEMETVNQMFDDILAVDGMWAVRRWGHFKAVTAHFAGGKRPSRRKVIVLNKP